MTPTRADPFNLSETETFSRFEISFQALTETSRISGDSADIDQCIVRSANELFIKIFY